MAPSFLPFPRPPSPRHPWYVVLRYSSSLVPVILLSGSFCSPPRALSFSGVFSISQRAPFVSSPGLFLSFFHLSLSVSSAYISHPPIAFLSVFCPMMHTILRFFCTNVSLLMIPSSLFLDFGGFVSFLFLCERCN